MREEIDVGLEAVGGMLVGLMVMAVIAGALAVLWVWSVR